MQKVKIDCDVNNINIGLIEDLIEFAAQKQVTCKYETRKAVKAKLESGAAKSEYAAERQVAEETGQKLATVHTRNHRAKKEEVVSKSERETTRHGAEKKPSKPSPPQITSGWDDHHNLYTEYLRCIREELQELSKMPEWKKNKLHIVGEVDALLYFVNDLK